MSANTLRSMATAALLILAAVVVGCSGNGSSSSAATATSADAAATSTPASEGAARSGSADLRTAVQQVVQQVRPAVVQITNEQGQQGLFNQGQTIPAGVGSGVIYDDQGHILTNNHVIEGAEKLLVTLPDGRAFPGTLVGRDPATDLAVVQIKGDNLPTAEIGDASKLQVGEWVVAIGNALALEGGPTVTSGVVSALGRAVQEPGDSDGSSGAYLLDMIQTDAAINPGNSGGPLLNLQGQVVGINTLVAGQAQGIGFSIASSTFKRIADQLVANGHVVHPYVGVQYVPLNAAVAAQLGTDVQLGIAIGSVQDGSPAANAGLQERDVITKVDGQDLKGESAFAEIIDQHKPGDTLTFTVHRGSQDLEVKVMLGEAPAP